MEKNTKVSNSITSFIIQPLMEPINLSVGGSLRSGPLASSTANTDTVDNISLLGLVPETASLVGTRGAGSTVNNVEGAEFPAADTEKEAEDVTLLLLLDFLDVLESAHFCCCFVVRWC